jgi:hypothetical protein
MMIAAYRPVKPFCGVWTAINRKAWEKQHIQDKKN